MKGEKEYPNPFNLDSQGKVSHPQRASETKSEPTTSLQRRQATVVPDHPMVNNSLQERFKHILIASYPPKKQSTNKPTALLSIRKKKYPNSPQKTSLLSTHFSFQCYRICGYRPSSHIQYVNMGLLRLLFNNFVYAPSTSQKAFNL